MDSRPSKDNYFPALDGLRGIMALGVVIAHVNLAWFPGAPIMMDIFFVISGFLITLVLQREVERTGSVRVFRFWGKRLLRLYPALLVVVGVSLLFAFVFVADVAPVINDAISSVLYYSNWLKLYNYIYPGMFGHTWSLSVEEQFYLLWPLFFAGALTLNSRKFNMLFFLMAIAGGAMLWRLYLIDQGAPWSRLYYALETRMDAFVAGGVLALRFNWLRERAASLAWHISLRLSALALLLLVVMGRPMSINYFIWQQSLALVLSMSAILLLTSPRENFLKTFFSGRLCVYLGLRCYSIYLWHWPIIWLLLMTTQLSKITMLLIVVPSTVLLASLTYKYVEVPFLSNSSVFSRTGNTAEKAL